MSYLLLSRRLFPLTRDIWYRHVTHDADLLTRDNQLATLALKPQAVLRAIQTVHVVFSTEDTPLHYTFFAQLVNLRALHISGDWDRNPIDTQSLQRLLDALPRFEKVELSDLPSELISIRLPDTVRSLAASASAFATDALARLPLRDLRIQFDPDDPVANTLPWEHLEQVEMQFRAGYAAAMLQTYADQTENGTRAGQLRSVTLNLLFQGRVPFPLARLLHEIFAEAPVESFDIFAAIPLAWEPLTLSKSIRKLEICLPETHHTKLYLDGFYEFLRANPTLEVLELHNPTDFVCSCPLDPMGCLLAREHDDLATHAPILFGLLHRIERSLGILVVRLYDRSTYRGIKWTRSTAAEEFVRDGFRRDRRLLGGVVVPLLGRRRRRKKSDHCHYFKWTDSASLVLFLLSGDGLSPPIP